MAGQEQALGDIRLADDEGLGRKGTARRRYGPGSKRGAPWEMIAAGGVVAAVVALLVWNQLRGY